MKTITDIVRMQRRQEAELRAAAHAKLLANLVAIGILLVLPLLAAAVGHATPVDTSGWPANWQELISHPEPSPEPSPAALLALGCVALMAVHFWPLIRGGLGLLAITLYVLGICTVGLFAAMIGWSWLDAKCAAALTDTDGQGERI